MRLIKDTTQVTFKCCREQFTHLLHFAWALCLLLQPVCDGWKGLQPLSATKKCQVPLCSHMDISQLYYS